MSARKKVTPPKKAATRKGARKRAARRQAAPPEAPRPLTTKQLAFVREYLVDFNGTLAAIRAGYSPHTAEQQASRLLRNVQVSIAIEEALKKRQKRTQITTDRVLKRWWKIANADPNELIDLRRVCCRYCWGVGHRYQRTPAEYERDLRQWEDDAARAQRDAKEPPRAFDEMGGVGYDARLAPHPECPECFGEGEVKVFPKDTRTLSSEARLLYAGVKQTKEGLEVKLRNQDDALLNVAKHLGMFDISTRDPGEVPEWVVRREGAATPDDLAKLDAEIPSDDLTMQDAP